MPTTGSIIKLKTESTGIIFYRVVSVNPSSYTIKALCRVRKGFLTIKYENDFESQIFKSEVGINYLEATSRETGRIKEILEEPTKEICQFG
jgi:hypothetical protein